MHCEHGTAPGDSHGHSSQGEPGQRGRAARDQEQGKELPTPSHVSSEPRHVLLRDRNSVTGTRAEAIQPSVSSWLWVAQQGVAAVVLPTGRDLETDL